MALRRAEECGLGMIQSGSPANRIKNFVLTSDGRRAWSCIAADFQTGVRSKQTATRTCLPLHQPPGNDRLWLYK